MVTHSHNLGDDSLARPIDAEHLGELFQVVCGCFADGEYGVTEPAHAEAAQLLVEELYTQLAGKQWDVFDNGKSHSPLLVLGQLDYGWQKRLRQKINADN